MMEVYVIGGIRMLYSVVISCHFVCHSLGAKTAPLTVH